MNASEMKNRAIYVTRHGSHAYGLNTPTSDLDVKGVLVGETAHYIGFLNRIEQIEEKDPNDLVIYELTKFFKLASDCNPNIIEVLWTDPSDILFINALGEKLRALAKAFLSQKAKHTFSGYAMAQLKRMRNHHEWMANPPKQPMSREELGLPQSKQWCAHIDADPTLIERKVSGSYVLTDKAHEDYAKELAWREASRKYAHYQEWLAGRNPKRHELEAKFGYDTKHGMHLVRLMRMGREILETGKVVVKRPDREELLAIRNEGIWSYEEIVEYAERMDAALTAFYQSGKSPLPKEPNRKMLDNYCVEIINTYMVSDAIGDHRSQRWDGKVS